MIDPKERTVKAICNFIDVYKSDKSHNRVWLEAQISHQLHFYAEDIEMVFTEKYGVKKRNEPGT